jgi:GNAT superfamily N-acetyltransferase
MANAKLTIHPAHALEEKREFAHFPWQVYRDDPNWVPPFISERMHFLDKDHHPFFGHADAEFFVARRDGKLVGTIAAVVNHRHNEIHEEQAGFFGFFEVLQDQEAAEALLETACNWVRDQGMTAIRGPENLSLNEEAGLLVDGWNGPPVIMMTYNPRYYMDFIEGAGFYKAMDLLAYMVDIYKYGPRAENMPPKLLRVAEKIQKRGGFTVRSVNMRHVDEEVQRIKKIYHAAWEKNWGFVPMTEVEIDHLAANLKAMVDPKLVWVAEQDGETIGMLLNLPDLNQPLLKAYPRPGVPEWWSMLKFGWHWKVRRSVTTLRGLVGGILEERRGLGVMAVMMVKAARAALPRYRQCELSWILENNTPTRQLCEMLGGYVYRTYRIYEKML